MLCWIASDQPSHAKRHHQPHPLPSFPFTSILTPPPPPPPARACALLFVPQCTEYHHVYKLEAIDCSYLCCAGGGQEGANQTTNLAPAADRIWDMALAMLAVAAHGSKLPAPVGASEPGGGAVLKIGIHTGRYPSIYRCSYSYRSFDNNVPFVNTVNTSTTDLYVSPEQNTIRQPMYHKLQ